MLEDDEKKKKDDPSAEYDNLKHIFESSDTAYYNGIRNSDIDWILRDANICAPIPTPQQENGAESESPKEDSEKPDAADSTSISSTSTASSVKKRPPGTLPLVGAQLNRHSELSNEQNPSKSKPSISPIQEEPLTPAITSNAGDRGRRRASSISAGMRPLTGHGFFSKLKEKFTNKSTDANSRGGDSLWRSEQDLGLKRSLTNTGSGSSHYSTRSKRSDLSSDSLKLSRTMSMPNYGEHSIDPRLQEYIDYYRKDNCKENTSTLSSLSGQSKDEDTSLRPLHSALVNQFDTGIGTGATPVDANNAQTGKFSFLRKRSNSAAPLPTVTEATEKNRRTNPCYYQSLVSCANQREKSPPQQDVPPEFQGLKPLKRVAFHSLTFLIDPPQQIPSRCPRKGNVELKQDGTLKINPLSEEDKKAIEKAQYGQGGGIVVGGSGSLGAKKVECVHSGGDTTDSPIDEVHVDKHAKLLGIDKPMVSRNKSYSTPVKKMALDTMYTRCCHLREILPLPAILKQIPPGSLAPIPILQVKNPEPTMIEIQTFADFVRIAPIICVSLDGVSLTFEQFKVLLSALSAKKHLEKLSLRNTPIDQKGWPLLCWFLSKNKVLRKLDISQCPSLSVNIMRKRKLVNDKYKDDAPRMSSNKDNRSDMNWTLLTATLVARGGIEELILTGCCINDLDVFEKLINLAVLIKTSRLGLAYNKLTAKHFKVVVDNWVFKSIAQGIDLGYNDLLSLQYVKILNEKLKDEVPSEKLKKSNLTFISLNAANLRFSDGFKHLFENYLIQLPNLKYLDLSNNPKLFGTSLTNNNLSPVNSASEETHLGKEAYPDEKFLVEYFASKFPLFPKLVRLSLDNNNFSTPSLIVFAQCLPFCKSLGYFSVLGNKLDLPSATALVQSIKNSKSLITLPMDGDDLPGLLKERYVLFTMKNMERIYQEAQKSQNEKKDSLGIIAPEEDATTLAEEMSNILAKKSQNASYMDDPEVKRFINKVTKMKEQLKEAIDKLLELQLKEQLNLGGKETLVRFMFLNSTIERGLYLIDNSLSDLRYLDMTSAFLTRNSGESEIQKYGDKETDPPEDNKELVPNTLNIPFNKSPHSISRNSSRTSLLDKEEGSALKLLKLHDYHYPSTDGSMFKDLSGEKIREKLLSVDMSEVEEVINILTELKNEGISLAKVFNLDSADRKKLAEGRDYPISIEDITGRLKVLKERSSSILKGQEGKDLSNPSTPKDEKNPKSDEGQPADTEDNSEHTSKLYDELLNEITKLNV